MNSPVMEASVNTAETDLDLKVAIEEALWRMDTTRITHPDLEIVVRDGQATVSGVVNSPMIQELIEETLRGLPELAGVTMRLVNDDALKYAAAYALATNPRTRSIQPGCRVVSHDGYIHVIGNFSPVEAVAAEEVIRGISGVRGVKVN